MRKDALQSLDNTSRARAGTGVGRDPYERTAAVPQQAKAHTPLPSSPLPVGDSQAILSVSLLGPAPVLRHDEDREPAYFCFDSHSVSVCLCAFPTLEEASGSDRGLRDFVFSLHRGC